MMNRSTCLGLAAALGLALIAPAVAEAQTYPSRPVRLLIGNSPGGPSDLSLRGMAEILREALGQPFVVENRPGGSGVIAGEACARATPDGHTLCMADSFNVALNPIIHQKLPYHPVRDLTPIIHTGFLPSGFWVPATLPVNSIGELFDLARSKPGTINWASFGTASSGHIYVEWFRSVKGIDFANIPYKSAVDAWRAVMAGESHISIYALRAGLPQVEAGKVKLLAVNTDERSKLAPAAPTFKEAGIETVMITWFGLFAPKGTPQAIIDTLNAAIVKGLFNDPEMRDKYLDKQGLAVYGVAGRPPAEFATFIGAEVDKYANLVKIANVKAEE